MTSLIMIPKRDRFPVDWQAVAITYLPVPTLFWAVFSSLLSISLVCARKLLKNQYIPSSDDFLLVQNTEKKNNLTYFSNVE